MIGASCTRVHEALVDLEALCALLRPGDMTAIIEHFDPRTGEGDGMV